MHTMGVRIMKSPEGETQVRKTANVISNSASQSTHLISVLAYDALGGNVS